MTDNTTGSLRTAHTYQLSEAALGEIRALLDAAFDGDFDDGDWSHGLGGIHAFIRDRDGLAAHGSVIMRRVVHGERSYRVGYLEAVAVRADRRRQGLGGRVTGALERVIDGAYELGALSASDDGAELYRSRGWRSWRGRVEVLSPGGVVPLPGEEDSTFLRQPPGRSLPDPSAGSLLFDWRDGDVL